MRERLRTVPEGKGEGQYRPFRCHLPSILAYAVFLSSVLPLLPLLALPTENEG